MFKISKILLLSLLLFCFSCNETKYSRPTVKIQTYFGDIIVELYPEKAPVTVKAFLSYVDSGYYRNSSFYRVLKAEDQPSNSFKSQLIQGGLWQVNYKKQHALPGIPLETTRQTGLLHTDGVISIARAEPESGNTEFFICLGNQPVYDYGGSASEDGLGYATFGKVIKGMKFVRQIQQQPDLATTLNPPIKILDIKRL